MLVDATITTCKSRATSGVPIVWVAPRSGHNIRGVHHAAAVDLLVSTSEEGVRAEAAVEFKDGARIENRGRIQGRPYITRSTSQRFCLYVLLLLVDILTYDGRLVSDSRAPPAAPLCKVVISLHDIAENVHASMQFFEI